MPPPETDSPSLHNAVSAAEASSMLELFRSLCIWFTSMKRNSWVGDRVSAAVRYPDLFCARFWLAVSSTAWRSNRCKQTGRQTDTHPKEN